MTLDAFWTGQRVLVLAPHADDETFGAGGLMAKVKAAGGHVYVIVASVGDLLHYGVGSVASLEAETRSPARRRNGERVDRIAAIELPRQTLVSGEQRLHELEQAMSVLQVDGYEVLFTDPAVHLRLDALPLRDLVAQIERDARFAIDKIAPTLLVLPAPSYNQDHEALFKAGFTACRPHLASQRPFIPYVLSCEAPQLGWHHQPWRPSFYVDISSHLDTKLRAHACHVSQLKSPPHLASLENLERIARVRGAEISVEAAEAFQCHRIVF